MTLCEQPASSASADFARVKPSSPAATTRARAHPSRIGLLLGDASYSIYLIHPFAQRAFLLVVLHTIGLGAISPTAYIFTSFGVGILAGVICYLVLERRVLALGRRLIRRKPPT